MKRLILIVLVGVVCFSCNEKKQEQPNILFIMSDDHTTQAFGIYGSRLATLNPTPNIDALGQNGIVFDNVFCNNAICTPSRASILTGQYPQKNGVLDLHHFLPKEKQYLPQEMNKLGYETAVIGKWHLKEAPESFDYYEVLPLQGKYHNPELISREGKITRKLNFGRYGKHEVNITEYEGHSSDIITHRSIDWLKNRKDKSKLFLLMHQFKVPHDMFEFAERYTDYLEDAYIPEPASLYQTGNHGSVATQGENGALKSLMETGKEPEGWRTATYYRYWMHMGSRHANPAHFGIRTKKYKLIFYYGRYYKPGTKSDNWGRYDFDTPPAWEFYDLTRDPGEMQNEYHNPGYKEIIADMKSELANKRKVLDEEDKNYPHIQQVIEKHWND